MLTLHLSSIPYITAPAPQYMLPSHTHHSHMPGAVHMVSPAQIRAEQPQRKRPKYTRSKTGCLTCRAKKIKVRTRSLRELPSHHTQFSFFSPAPARHSPNPLKCDEGKPNCHRCEHAHREVSSGSEFRRSRAAFPFRLNEHFFSFPPVHLARPRAPEEEAGVS